MVEVAALYLNLKKFCAAICNLSADFRICQVPSVKLETSKCSDFLNWRRINYADKLRGDIEFANQWRVIGKLYFGNFKIRDVDARAVEYVIKLPSRRTAWMRGFALAIRIFQAGGSQEQLQLPVPPQDIEIAGQDVWSSDVLDYIVQITQLVMPMTEFYRQVHQEDG